MVKSIGVCFFVITGLFLAANNSGQAFTTWPDTGQTKCYDAAGAEILPCPAEGVAFHGQDAQFVGPVRSYTLYNSLDLNGGSWVRDNVTGLIWELKKNMDGVRNYGDPHDADNIYYLDSGTPNSKVYVVDKLNEIGFGGYNDWRLPTIQELSTLSDFAHVNPAIDTIFAATTKSSNYWSSTYYMSSLFAYVINFLDGGCGSAATGSTSAMSCARAVRGGQ